MLAASRTDDIALISDSLVALHSSDPATVYLSALARMRTPSISAVEQALYRDRCIVRHHAMRRTLWVMTPDVAMLAHGAATAKIALTERKRTIAAMTDSTDIEDPEAWFDTATAEIDQLLVANGPLSTRAIGKALPHLVVPLRFGVKTKHPATINAHTKVLQGAGFNADLIRAEPTGNWVSSEYLWTSPQAWLGQSITGLEELPAALGLLSHWLERFGPATEADIRWWFGWTAGLMNKALRELDVRQVDLDDDNHGYVLARDQALPEDPGPWVRLLPGLDPTAMGWKQRDWYLDPALVPTLFDRVGNAGPTVWVDGHIVGAWSQRSTGEIAVDVPDLSRTHQSLLDEAVDELRAAVGDVVVRPRFPTPAQKALYESEHSL